MTQIGDAFSAGMANRAFNRASNRSAGPPASTSESTRKYEAYKEQRRAYYAEMRARNAEKERRLAAEKEKKIDFRRQQALQQQAASEDERQAILKANLGVFSDAANNSARFERDRWIAGNDNQQAELSREFAGGQAGLDRRLKQDQFGQGLAFDHRKLNETQRQFDQQSNQRADEFDRQSDQRANEFGQGMQLDQRKLQQSGRQFEKGLEMDSRRLDQSGQQFKMEQQRLGKNSEDQLRLGYDRMGQDEKQTQRELAFRTYDAEANRGMRRDDLDARVGMFGRSQDQSQDQFDSRRRSQLEDGNLELDMEWNRRLGRARQGSMGLSAPQQKQIEEIEGNIERIRQNESMLPRTKLQAIKKLRARKLTIFPETEVRSAQQDWEQNRTYDPKAGSMVRQPDGTFRQYNDQKYTTDQSERIVNVQEADSARQERASQLELQDRFLDMASKGGMEFLRANPVFQGMIDSLDSQSQNMVSKRRQGMSNPEIQDLKNAAAQSLASEGATSPTNEEIDNRANQMLGEKAQQDIFTSMARADKQTVRESLGPRGIAQLQGDIRQGFLARGIVPTTEQIQAETRKAIDGITENYINEKAHSVQPDPLDELPPPPQQDYRSFELPTEDQNKLDGMRNQLKDKKNLKPETRQQGELAFRQIYDLFLKFSANQATPQDEAELARAVELWDQIIGK